MAVQNERHWIKGQLDLWCCLISFTISCKYYDIHLNSHRNMNILRFLQYKYIRNQTGIVVKRSRSTQIHHLCIPGRAHMPKITYNVPSSKAVGLLVPENEILKGVLPYIGILVM